MHVAMATTDSSSTASATERESEGEKLVQEAATVSPAKRPAAGSAVACGELPAAKRLKGGAKESKSNDVGDGGDDDDDGFDDEEDRGLKGPRSVV